MAEAKTRRSTAASATPAQRRIVRKPRTAVDRTAALSKDVAQSVEDGRRAAIEAVHEFVDTVEPAVPALPHGEGPSRRQEIIDPALEMADRLVHVQYEFIREVVASAGKGLSRARTQANRAPTAVDHRTRLGGCSIR